MCARRVQYDGGGPLNSRRYVELVMSGRVEEYGENGAVPLWLDQAAVVCSDWERSEGMRYEKEHQLHEETAAFAGNNSNRREQQRQRGTEINTSNRKKDVR